MGDFISAPSAPPKWDKIKNPTSDKVFSMAGYETTFNSTLDEAAHSVITIHDTAAALANATNLLTLKFTANGDAEGIFLECLDNAGGDSKLQIQANGCIKNKHNDDGYIFKMFDSDTSGLYADYYPAGGKSVDLRLNGYAIISASNSGGTWGTGTINLMAAAIYQNGGGVRHYFDTGHQYELSWRFTSRDWMHVDSLYKKIYFGNATDTACLALAQITTPSDNPDAGTDAFYFKSDDKLYQKSSGGTEIEVGAGSFLKLDQTTPQSVINGIPTFAGINSSAALKFTATGDSYAIKLFNSDTSGFYQDFLAGSEKALYLKLNNTTQWIVQDDNAGNQFWTWNVDRITATTATSLTWYFYDGGSLANVWYAGSDVYLTMSTLAMASGPFLWWNSGLKDINFAVGTSTNADAFWIDAGADTIGFNSNLVIDSGINIVLNTTTGTKIGTATNQLLGFYNATPVNQPDTVSDAATQDLTGTDTIDQAKTEADLTSCKNAINTIIDRLQELGLIA